MALLGMALHARGVPAVSFTGSQSGIITDGAHTNARILEVRPVRILTELARDRVVIVAGYQGVSREKEVTTLGRGGSDTTAVALAAALEAEVCEICSDVDGVFTRRSAHRRGRPQAVRAVARRDAGAGAGGGQGLERPGGGVCPRPGITIHARSTFGSGTGTKVVAGGRRELRISGVALDAGILVVRGPALPVLQAHGAWPRETWDDRCIVSLENVHALPALLAALRGVAEVEEGLAQVSIVGTGIGASKEPLDRALAALGRTAPGRIGVAAAARLLASARDRRRGGPQTARNEFIRS